MNSTAQKYLIGNYQFDQNARLLSGPNGEYQLSPEIVGVIGALVEHAGEPVGRDQIIRSIWKGNESANRLLTLNIRCLRRYLGDSCRNPRFIETVHGFGYRLVAPVRTMLPPTNRKKSNLLTQGGTQEKLGLWQFLLEMRQRKVSRAALMYALSVWLICQIGEVVFDALNFPEWTLSLVVVAGVLGFPIALILAWTFEVTPSGLALDIPVAKKETGHYVSRDIRWNSALLVASVMISCQMLVYGFGFVDDSNDNLGRLRNAESIIVTPFRATSVSLETKAYAFILSEELRHLLNTEYQLDVISADTLATLSSKQKKADLLLQGSVTITRGEIQVMMHLVDPANGYDLWSDMILIPASGLANSQHDAAQRMLRTLPFGSPETREEPEVIAALVD